MGSEHVRVEQNDAVTTIILDRQQARNAVDRPTADALVKAFLTFESDPKAKVAVLWGAGGTFSAGADLKALSTGRGNRVSAPGQQYDPHAGDAPMGPTRMRLSKPVIAAVAGYAVAGGLELACWCDLPGKGSLAENRSGNARAVAQAGQERLAAAQACREG